MTYSIILALHLTAAAVTGVIIFFALFAVLRGKSAWYKTAALALGSIAAFEVFSGTLLAIVSPTISATSLSLHIFEYLGVCLAVEALLFVRMKKVSLTFPLQAASLPALVSVLLFFAAISYGF